MYLYQGKTLKLPEVYRLIEKQLYRYKKHSKNIDLKWEQIITKCEKGLSDLLRLAMAKKYLAPVPGESVRSADCKKIVFAVLGMAIKSNLIRHCKK